VDYIGYKTVSLDERILSERLREMSDLGIKAVMFAGEGEPLLHKQINKLVLSSPMDVAFTTNGVLLDKLETLPICKWVKVSLNAGTRETYAKVHRTKPEDFDRVWANIKDAVKRKGNCQIGVQMVALPENEGEWMEFEDRASDAGVDYTVIKPYSQHKFSLTRQYEGYKPIRISHGPNLILREKAIQTTEHDYEKCNATPFFWAYIMSSGEIYSCSAYLLDERFRLGNINDQTFKDIWEGERRRANWELVRKHLDIKECRVNCRMQRVNEYLDGFSTVKNVSFI
jgi:radical SAM protein with 4Fe4S-binding SPASM domain